MLTFASPRMLATYASVPGRFSMETESCFVFGMFVPLGWKFMTMLSRGALEKQRARGRPPPALPPGYTITPLG